MPRTHIIQSWVGACEYDEGDTYNGQQIGNRAQKSVGVLFERDGDQWKVGKPFEDIPTYVNGRPNIQAFAEPISKPKTPAKKKTAFQSISLADSNYERLCGLSDALDTQLDNGELSFEDWTYARRQIDQRLAKAWSRLCKARNWNESGESLDSSLDCGLTFSLEGVQSQQIVEKNKHKTHVHTGWVVVDGLSEENVFRVLFCKVKQAMLFIERIKQQF